MRGADVAGLEAKIKQHYVVPQIPEASGSGSNESVGSVNGYPDITRNIDVGNVILSSCGSNNQVECLNQQDSHPVRNIITPGSAYLESDVDEQLFIFFTVSPGSTSIHGFSFSNIAKSLRCH